MSRSVLVIDLDRHAAESLRAALESFGVAVRVAYDWGEITRLDITRGFTAIMVDPRFPEMNGEDVMEYVRRVAPRVPLVALLQRPDARMEQKYLNRGAGYTIAKPYAKESVALLLEEVESGAGGARFDFPGMIGKSPPMQRLFESIRSVAGTDSTAIIYGETGVGKELIAYSIHKLSARRDKKFVTINCGTLSESLLASELFGHEKGAFTGAHKAKQGKFEFADGGTLFLDEIGEITPAAQVSLLKVIETGEVERLGSNKVVKTDTRMIFATNRDLAAEVKSGRFRRDLYYRINVFPLHAPPLRERTEDIPLLAEYYLSVYNERHKKRVDSISPAALSLLKRHRWEGNVRELVNVIERAVIVARGAAIEPGDLDITTGEVEDTGLEDFTGMTYREMSDAVMSVYDRRYFTTLLEECKGNMSLVAKKAGLDRKTLYTKLSAIGVDPGGFRESSK